MADFRPDVSIIILAKNEIRHIRPCLEMALAQKTSRSYEVTVVDSGSGDGTVEAVRRFPSVNLVQIKPEEFKHGRTRNQGASLAKGEYLVFLNADAIPATDRWLESLVDAFHCAEKVAGIYSRHIPRENCHLYMARDIRQSMPGHRIIKDKAQALDFMLFSTVSAAIRRELWEKFPFDDNIPIAEDQVWAKTVLASGYRIVYEPDSAVCHSHNYSPAQLFRVKAEVGRATKAMRGWHGALGSLILMLGGIFVKSGLDFIYIMKQKIPFRRKIREIGISLMARTVSFAGRFAGMISARKKF